MKEWQNTHTFEQDEVVASLSRVAASCRQSVGGWRAREALSQARATVATKTEGE